MLLFDSPVATDFTAGLGGSGDINLYITNEGFGDAVPVFRGGKLSPQLSAGSGLRKVPFFLESDQSEPSAQTSRSLVGERTVWDWPFPEGCTVAEKLQIRGDSSVGMGTAPELWNTIMGFMVEVVPRNWWKKPTFSQGLARFSKPLVTVTDRFTGETHAMRVDVTSAVDASRTTAVQAHTSFRRCVGQSCAEFTLACLEARGLLGVAPGGGGVGDPAPGAAAQEQAEELRQTLSAAGVYLPEELFADPAARAPMLERLLGTPGTLNAGFETSVAPQDC